MHAISTASRPLPKAPRLWSVPWDLKNLMCSHFHDCPMHISFLICSKAISSWDGYLFQRTNSGRDGSRVPRWLISKNWTMHRSVRHHADVFRSGFRGSTWAARRRLHSGALLQGRLKSCKCSLLGPACWECTFAAPGGLEVSCQLLLHISIPSFLCEPCLVLESSRGSACALYGCSTHKYLWGSLLPEATDPEVSEDKRASSDLGMRVSIWSWLCSFLPARL